MQKLTEGEWTYERARDLHLALRGTGVSYRITIQHVYRGPWFVGCEPSSTEYIYGHVGDVEFGEFPAWHPPVVDNLARGGGYLAPHTPFDLPEVAPGPAQGAATQPNRHEDTTDASL